MCCVCMCVVCVYVCYVCMCIVCVCVVYVQCVVYVYCVCMCVVCMYFVYACVYGMDVHVQLYVYWFNLCPGICKRHVIVMYT